MYTGIIQSMARIVAIKAKKGYRTHWLEFSEELIRGLTVGASVAHNGCCLTVTDIQHSLVSFDIVDATLQITNLGILQVGSLVHIERSAVLGSEVGGHLLSGHVSFMAKILASTGDQCCRRLYFAVDKPWVKYILPKGFIAVDGVSLTVAEVTGEQFYVNLIPQTLKCTMLGEKHIGERVNIELDRQVQATVDTIEKFLIDKQFFIRH